MKKSILFVCGLALSVGAFASVNPKMEKRTMERAITPNVRLVETQATITDEPVHDLFKNHQADAIIDTLIVPYVVDGGLNTGTPSSGIGYVNLAEIVVPLVDTVRYINYYGGALKNSSWYVEDQLAASDTNMFEQLVDFFGEYPLPVMKTPDFKYHSDPDSLYAFRDYQLGALYTSYYAGYGFYNALSVAPATLTSLTKCAMYTEEMYDNRGDLTYGSDWTFYTATGSGVGDYWYGTKMKDPKSATDEYFNTIFVPYYQDATMYIDHVSLGIFTMADGGANGIFPGENDHVRLSIYPLTDQGIDWENPIARAVATKDDYIPCGGQYNIQWYGVLNFNFTKEDPISGAMTETAALVSGNFIVALDEFNDGTANFGIITDGLTIIEGDTYLASASRITQLWSAPGNLLLNLYAIYPEFLAPERVEFGIDETEKTISVPSNIWDEDIDFDAPDWINVEIVTDYDEFTDEGETYQEHKFVDNVKITLSGQGEVREGSVEFNLLGMIPVTLVVSQTNQESAVENIYMRSDNKLYNVLGVEVGEDYKGVVIRNGEKFVR
jgi:hypothetical protein